MIKEYIVSIDGYSEHDSRISINLRYVASAMPFLQDETEIQMNGSSKVHIIREEYSRFLRDWQSVKR